MDKCKGCDKLGRMVTDRLVVAYQSSLLQSPVVSVWDCIVRKMRKGKKKQVKDELDRIKQAEKKKRRLEKALATSAAIRSELEKKKQKKKEEQQKLDEEGAAIAEAVALHVLVGEESDDSCELLLKKDKESNQWDLARNLDLFMSGERAMLPHQDLSIYSVEGAQWVSGSNGDGCLWNEQENASWMASSVPWVGNVHHQWFDEGNWEVQRISAGLLAAQAVSSLQIAGDAPVDSYVFDRMLR